MRVQAIAGALALCASLLGAPAFAEAGDEVGKISVLDGAGKRVAKDGEQALAVGLPVRVGDTVLLTRGNAKLILNDESTLFLGVAGEGKKQASLTIDEASFENQVRKGFMATLGVGKLWSKVKKAVAGSDAKFEVTTDRAVAGVRGTIFRVDAVSLVKGTKPSRKTAVWVTEGAVGVSSRDKLKAKPAAAKGPRREVPGPQEISKGEWEQRFAELQKGMAVRIDGDEWSEVVQAPPTDAFAAFVDRNDG